MDVSFEPNTHVWMMTGEGMYSIFLIKDRKPVKLAQDSLGDEEAHACANLTIGDRKILANLTI